MKYFVDDLDLETAANALDKFDFGLEKAEDSRGVCYVTIWTEKAFETRDGQTIGGYIVGSLHRNTGTFATYTLTFTEHLNDRKRMSAVLNQLLDRKSMR